MIDIYGTLGPSCSNESILEDMFHEGMTGIRINLSHVMLADCCRQIERINSAASKAGVTPKILIDMQGPELRIGILDESITLREGDVVFLGNNGIPVQQEVIDRLECGDEIMLDDGKILVSVIEIDNAQVTVSVKRGGTLTSRKSIAIVGKTIYMPTMTDADIENLKCASNFNIYGIMQPFVRNKEDLIAVRNALDENGCQDMKIFAKIENMDGVNSIKTFMKHCDEIIIARGDLGNSMPLWELPRIQKYISSVCREYNKPFMVVTQMLSSMEHCKVPTRAEVCDIYNAACDGASSVMVTGESAIGEYPVEVIKYLKKTVETVGYT